VGRRDILNQDACVGLLAADYSAKAAVNYSSSLLSANGHLRGVGVPLPAPLLPLGLTSPLRPLPKYNGHSWICALRRMLG
jgi:hypothetical protein